MASKGGKAMDKNIVAIPKDVEQATQEIQQAKARIQNRREQQRQLRQQDLMDVEFIAQKKEIVEQFMGSDTYKSIAALVGAIAPTTRRTTKARVITLYPVEYINNNKQVKVFSKDKVKNVVVDKDKVKMSIALIGEEHSDTQATSKGTLQTQLGYTHFEARRIVQQIWEHLHLNGR